mgnify:CR=1 FL=1
MRGKKNLFYAFLAICLMWVFLPEVVSASSGTIKVTGTTADFSVACGEGTAKYDSASKTLTLNNADIGPVLAGSPLIYGITIEEDNVTVELIGDNSINAYIGIWSSAPFRILGKDGKRGSLAIHVSKNQDIGTNYCHGIRIDNGGLTVQDADLQITFGELGTVNGYAIDICGKDNLIRNSSIVITMLQNSGTQASKTTGINATNADSLTIDNSNITMNTVDAGLAASGKLNIAGSEIVIDANQYAITCGDLDVLNKSNLNLLAGNGQAIGAGEYKITIDNSSVQAESEGNNGILCAELEVTNSSNVSAKGYWPAFFVKNHTMIEKSSVKAQSKGDVGIYSSNGSIEMSDSQVEAISDIGWAGILTDKNLALTNSDVISRGEADSPAIRAGGDISINGGTTEIGSGKIISGNDIEIAGTVTSNGKPSYDNIISNNPNGILIFPKADYSEVDKAIEEANGLKKEDYLNFEIVEQAVGAVIREKDIREQATVDGYAVAIRDAVKSLKPVPAPPVQIPIIEGADQEVEKGGTDGVTIKADGDFDSFTGISVDDKEIEADQYTASAGSTVIVLKPEYIDTLTEGTHKITIHFVNGTAQTTLTVKKKIADKPGVDNPSLNRPGDSLNNGQPQKPSDSSIGQIQGQKEKVKAPLTGDNGPVNSFLFLMFVSGVGMIACRIYRMVFTQASVNEN